jgi:N-acetylneuraminic acid mutarotase
MLPNGKVLVFDWDGSAELYDPATGTWSITVNPSPFRYSYTATLLQNGEVLLAGGFEYDCIGGCPSNSAELYDSATGTWTSTGNLNLARVGQTAMLLPSGKVLVFGGGNPGNSAELYDPATGTWSITASLNMARVAYTATLLSNGKVLVEGGNVSGGPGTLNTAELYDSGAESASTPTPTPTVTPTPTATPTATPTPTSTPAAVVSPSWTITGSLNTAHNFGHTATRLPNGKVLVAGGAGDSGSLNNTELYDPATGTWSTTGSLNTPRDSHTATLLQNGKVLVAGGFSCGPPPQVCSQLNSAELYDPVAGTWSSTGNLNTARDSHTATLLPNGIVLVAGGFLNGGELNSAELYDPATGIWTSTGNLNIGRYRYTTTLLQSGKVLVAGGVNSNGALNSAELYDPATGMWTSTGNLNTARELHTATLLYNGKVLVASGFVDFALGRVTNSAELYDPATGLWTMTGNLNQGRAFHTATLLTSGKVLVAGGFFVDGLPNITNSAELYDPATGTWSNTASLNTARRFHTATLLLNGEVLAAGGSGGNTAELYDTGINPIEDAPFFVRMQYLDFLGREPEPDGLQFYLDILNGCQPSDIECIKYTRGAISANFFRSPEFQRKGSFVMYLYMVSLGQRPVTPAELNDQSKIDRPHYGEFIADLQSISDPTDDPVIGEAKKVALTDAWMQRTEIQNKYGGLSNGAFVQKLLDTAGVTLANQSALVDDLNAARKTRAQVLRAIAESAEVNAKFYKQAFVTMEYFGYLRRDPESCVGSPDPANCGYIFHNSRFQLAADPDFLENTIVRGFIESPEYRQRFGQP